MILQMFITFRPACHPLPQLLAAAAVVAAAAASHSSYRQFSTHTGANFINNPIFVFQRPTSRL